MVAGLKHARGSWAVVMDGDLQHPPQLAAKLVQIGQSRSLDLVAGSRYTGAGASDGLAGGYRRAVSGLATRLTKAVFPRRLSRLSDPMSGFFAVRLAALDLDRLDPIGFKILLELMIRQPRLQVAEVPFVFGTRIAGESKAIAAGGTALPPAPPAIAVAGAAQPGTALVDHQQRRPVRQAGGLRRGRRDRRRSSTPPPCGCCPSTWCTRTT